MTGIRRPRAPRRHQQQVDDARHQTNLVREQLREVQAQRDRLQRYFNRLDAAITHHKRDAVKYDVPEIHDEALWAARDRILRDSCEGKC